MHLTGSNLIWASVKELNPETAGRFVGQTVGYLALLAGVLKCWSISRRPTTNTKCALALMFVLLSMLSASVVGMLSKSQAVSPIKPIASGLLGLIMLGCLVTALVLAIIGLTELSSRPGVFTQGRAQAIWALVLVGVFGLIAAGGVVAGVMRVRQFASTGPGSRPGQVLTFEELNFRFRSPERPWTPFNASKINQDAKLSFMRRLPEMYFMVIAERLGRPNEFSCEELAELGKAHLQSAALSSHVLSETPFHLNGLNGLRVETEATVATYSLYYQHWYIATNGYAYQLIGYGRSRDRAQVAAEMPKMFGRFELIDSTRVALAPGGGFTTNFVSSQYGYLVVLTNSTWHPYPGLTTELPAAEFGASRGDSCFVVVPVWLAGEKPDLDSLTAGLLATMQIRFPDEELKNRRRYTPDNLEGVQYDYERGMDKARFRYRLGILRYGPTAFLVAAWTQRQAADAGPILDDAFSRVHFRPSGIPLLSASKPFTSRERKTQGLVLNQAALFHFNAGDYTQALTLFRAALNANRAESLYLVNALQTWSHLERPREALDFLGSQPSAVMSSPDVRVWQAYFQAEAGLTEQALTNFQAVFAAGYRNDNHFSRYINVLNGERRYPEALSAIEQYLEKEDSIPVRLLEAETYRLKEDYPKATAVLKQQREKAPFNSQVAEALANTMLAAGSYNEALEITRELAKTNPKSAYSLFLRGKSELGLKWYRDAKNSFDTAAALAPADKTIRSYIDLVSGFLGEGNNSAVQEPLEPVAIPAAWTNRPAEAVPAKYAGKHGAYYLRRVLATSWRPGTEHRTTEYFHVQLLDSSGVSAFSTLQRAFDPLYEQLFVNEIRVLDRSGNTVSTGKLTDYYVLDEHARGIASQRKVLNIPVPGLHPGCQLVVTITQRELGKLDEFPYLEHCFSRGFPVRESLVLLRGDVSTLKYRSMPECRPEKLPEGLCWRWNDPLVVRFEPLQPPLSTFAPMLWIADASNRWPALVTNYLASIADRLERDPAAAEQSRNLCPAADNTESKLAALAAYVQTNYTYKAIEFGRRARLPNKAVDIIRNKYGDCKDHALLLQQLLAAVGVPARLALVNYHSPVQKDLPSLDQFNHMILFVPGERDRFVDCADKGSDPVRGSPPGLSGRDALILDEKDPRFVTIPRPAVDGWGVELDRRVRVVDLENLTVEEALTVRGVQAAYLRDYLNEIPPASRQITFQSQMGLSDVEMTDFRLERLENPAQPLQIRSRYTLRKQLHRADNRLAGVLRAAVERVYLHSEPVDDRLSPFEIRAPLRLRTTVTLDFPAGYSAEPPPKLTPKLDSRFASCTHNWQVQGRSLKLQLECLQEAGLFKPADYPAFRQTTLQLLSLLEREIVLAPTPATGQ